MDSRIFPQESIADLTSFILARLSLSGEVTRVTRGTSHGDAFNNNKKKTSKTQSRVKKQKTGRHKNMQTNPPKWTLQSSQGGKR